MLVRARRGWIAGSCVCAVCVLSLVRDNSCDSESKRIYMLDLKIQFKRKRAGEVQIWPP